MRAMFICNEMLGLGHLGVSLAIARELVAEPGDAALVVTGSPAFASMRAPSGVEVLKIPTALPGSDSPWSKTALRPPGEHTAAPAEITAQRAEAYRAAVERFDPEVLIVDYRPLGRDDDIVPALKLARESGDRKIALGIWDSDDAPEALRKLWTPELLARAAEFYDLAFVYGPPAPDDVRVEVIRGAGIPVHETGFVSNPPAEAPAPDLDPGYLLVTAGGGVDGLATLDATLAAIRLSPVPVHTVLVTGPLMPQPDAHRLRAAAESLDVTIFAERDDLPELLVGARAVVSMTGYSTTAEILASGKPSLMVPRAVPREEQLNRARRLAAEGRIAMIHPSELTAESMRAALDPLLAQAPRPASTPSGAADVKRILKVV
jgi:predicted glycosyltransferase